jgi:predicted flap endonuclease-1-like 5' DNA nuclease
MIIYFIAGLLVGWVIEWIIDWRFWRQGDEELQKQLGAMQAKINAKEEEKTRLGQELARAKVELKAKEQETTGFGKELATAEVGLKGKEEEATNLGQELATAEAKNEKLLQHLREAEVLLGKHQKLDEKRRQQLTAADKQLRSQEEEMARLQRQLGHIGGELDHFKAMQGDKQQLQEQLAAAQAETERLQIELKALEGSEPELIYIVPDDLTKIKGIGPVFERYLNESGIYTFAQLGELTPERVRIIIGSKQLSKIDTDEWLQHAHVLANYQGSYLTKNNEPDDLTLVKGIGPVFGQRLNNAGIYTFAQLAALTPSYLKEVIVSPDDLPNVDADEWISEAQQVASKRKKEL